jgi:hypothetical protein
MAAIVYLILLVLFIRQADISRTPAGISRVSRWTFLSQAAADSISFIGVSIPWSRYSLVAFHLPDEQHLTFGILADGRPSLSLIVPAFLAATLLIYEAVSLRPAFEFLMLTMIISNSPFWFTRFNNLKRPQHLLRLLYPYQLTHNLHHLLLKIKPLQYCPHQPAQMLQRLLRLSQLPHPLL